MSIATAAVSGTGASGSSVVVEPPVPPRHRYQASNSQAATACERVQLGFAAARACRWATSWIMRTVLSRIPSDRTSLHGGRPERIRSGSTHRLEGPWQRALLRDPDAGGGCGLPTAACRTSSILWLVARSTGSASRAKSTARHVPPEKRRSEPEKRQQSGNHPSQAEKRRDWERPQRT